MSLVCTQDASMTPLCPKCGQPMNATGPTVFACPPCREMVQFLTVRPDAVLPWALAYLAEEDLVTT